MSLIQSPSLNNALQVSQQAFYLGRFPNISDTEAHAMVIKEPLGVVLAIAPWNAPLILGLRAVAAAVAAGNTAILKVT